MGKREGKGGLFDACAGVCMCVLWMNGYMDGYLSRVSFGRGGGGRRGLKIRK